jgi:SAM-dependent methyltransferase
MTLLNEITTCEVCGNSALQPVLDLGNHPLCDDLVPVGEDRTCREYPIDILFCPKCFTAHQHYQVPKSELFPKTYHYRSRFTADVLSGMSSLVDACEAKLGTISGLTVLDVGCNDGSLLDFFAKRGSKTIGIEPTDAWLDARSSGHHIVNDFFTPQTALEIREQYGKPDVITFTNVFAHIEDLRGLVDALKIVMKPSTMLVIENHYLGAVLNGMQFDTFYHEHPRTYSLTSFTEIARSLGVAISTVQFPSRYGGNIRVFLNGPKPAGEDEASIADILLRESQFGAQFGLMSKNVNRWRYAKGERLRKLAVKHGSLVSKAFPGRAAILVKLLSLDQDTIARVHEKPGSLKIGHYLPGTRIPIVHDDELFSSAPPPPVIINFAWHISHEITNYLRKAGYEGEIVDILEVRDFKGE